jgi:3',5'-cyclic AMP phosphodiesterase CpdA
MADANALIFHLSDIHFGLENNRALDWVKQEIANRRPDAVAITGDITMRARTHEFMAASAWIRSLDARLRWKSAITTCLIST